MKIKILRHRTLFLLLYVLLVGNACTSTKKKEDTTVESWLKGTWEGSAYQFNTDENWGMLLTTRSSKKTFKINYPSLKCSGKWKVFYVSENHMELREKITEGLRYCVTGGKVVLEKRRETLLFQYYYPDDTTLNAEGLLELRD